MKPPPFKYFAPDSLEEALELLEQYGWEAKVLAGGQSLIPAMNFRVTTPSILVDLNGLAELDYIKDGEQGGLLVGAMTRQSRAEKDEQVRNLAPLLHETLPQIAHPQIRNRGTVGGSLAHADPAAELPVVATALNARFKAHTRSGSRWIAADEFFQFICTTDLAPEEILVEVEFPAMPAHTGWAFVEFARRQGDYALVGAAALVTLDEARICRQARLVFLNAGPVPTDAPAAAALLVGENPGEQAIEAAARHAAEHEVDPIGNVHASPEYQRHLASVLAKRALQQAAQRAAASFVTPPEAI